MEDRVNKLERLDIAATANIAGDMLHRQQVWMLLMAVIWALLGAVSTASRIETLAVRAAAATYTVLFILFLLKWRYSFHAVVLASFGTAIIDYWLYPQLHLHSDWIGRLLSACVFISMGLTAWPWAMPFATIHKKGWEEDRRAVEKLYEMLLTGPGWWRVPTFRQVISGLAILITGFSILKTIGRSQNSSVGNTTCWSSGCWDKTGFA